MTSLLIATDIGNATTKFRRSGGPWEIEPSLVRTPDRAAFHFVEERTTLRPLIYRGGPAHIAPTPYLVGADAHRAGVSDLSMVGSAEMRARSDAYLLLHLWSILASLPPGVFEAQVAYAGGLPVDDYTNRAVSDILRARLKGTHHLVWGDMRYTLVIDKVLFVPQPIAALSTLLFDPDGRMRVGAELMRTRLALDIGGGTTDYTGRRGLELLPGSEGGVALGVVGVAERAAGFIRAHHPRLRTLSGTQVLEQLLRGQPTIAVAGEPLDVQQEIDTAMHQVAAEIVRHVARPWASYLEQGEVLLFGGGGEAMSSAITAAFGAVTRVTLLPHAIIRVADGIERLAKNRLAVELAA